MSNFNLPYQLNLNNLSLIIIFLLPISLITGPAIPDIFLSLIALFFIIHQVFTKKEFKFLNNIYVISFFLFFFFIVIRTLFSNLPNTALFDYGVIFYFRYLFFTLALIHIFFVKEKFLNYLFLLFFICLFVVSLDGVFQFFFGENFFGFEPPAHNRITGFFRNEPIMGRYLSYNLIIILILAYGLNLDKKYELILFISIPFIIFAVLVSGDRAPLLRLLIALFGFYLLIDKYRKIFTISIIMTSLIIILALFFSENIRNRLVKESIEMISQNEIIIAPFGGDYEKIYKTAYNIGSSNPMIGQGANSFKYYCDNKTYETFTLNCSHPHNFFFQIFTEVGLIGIIFVSFLYLILFKYLFRKIPKIENSHSISIKNIYHQNKSAAIALISLMCPIIPHMNFYNNWNNVFIFIILSLFCYSNKKIINLLKYK